MNNGADSVLTGTALIIRNKVHMFGIKETLLQLPLISQLLHIHVYMYAVDSKTA